MVEDRVSEDHIACNSEDNLDLICTTLYPFKFCNQLDEEYRAGCFALFVFIMSCYC